MIHLLGENRIPSTALFSPSSLSLGYPCPHFSFFVSERRKHIQVLHTSEPSSFFLSDCSDSTYCFSGERIWIHFVTFVGFLLVVKMMVAYSFDLWQKDAFFSAAEEVQDSADM